MAAPLLGEVIVTDAGEEPEPGPVVEMARCDYCRQTLPVDHRCPGGAPVEDPDDET